LKREGEREEEGRNKSASRLREVWEVWLVCFEEEGEGGLLGFRLTTRRHGAFPFVLSLFLLV